MFTINCALSKVYITGLQTMNTIFTISTTYRKVHPFSQSHFQNNNFYSKQFSNFGLKTRKVKKSANRNCEEKLLFCKAGRGGLLR